MFLKSVSTKIWKAPKKYLSILKKFYGVISPDFSVLRNMPLHKQKDAIFNGRLLAHWWQQNGIEVIPNVRFNDPRTYLSKNPLETMQDFVAQLSKGVVEIDSLRGNQHGFQIFFRTIIDWYFVKNLLLTVVHRLKFFRSAKIALFQDKSAINPYEVGILPIQPVYIDFGDANYEITR